MLANAQNKSMLNLTTTAPRVHGFATWDPTRRSSAVELFVINKFEQAQDVTFNLPSVVLRSAVESDDGHLERYLRVGVSPVPPTRAVSVIDTDDHWGEQVSASVACAVSA
jgi:hypothetical protein